MLREALAGPLFSALHAGSPRALRALVWADFRLAVALFVLAPLGVSFASLSSDEHDALRRIMAGYWQASSLLMLTVFLNAAAQPVGFSTAALVQAMIPLSLYWWRDLGEEVRQRAARRPLARFFLAWRAAASALAVAGAAGQLAFFQRCNAVGDLLGDAQCAAWLEPPFAFRALLLPGVPPSALGALGYAGLLVYLPYLAYMALAVVRRVGRSGRASRRGLFTSVSVLAAWGWIDRDSSQM